MCRRPRCAAARRGRTVNLRARAATLKDADLLRAWRNDPVTREMSLHHYEVTVGEHEKWLDAVLRDSSVVLMIVERRTYGSYGVGYTPIGTYRLDDVGTDVVEVSLTLAPDWRGYGYGREVIQMAVTNALSCGARSVMAVILPRNIAS